MRWRSECVSHYWGSLCLSMADSFHIVLLSVGLIGIGSAVFHPEASRVARMASGGKHGMAQSLFQVGGNAGSSLGPLLAALILLPYGRFQVIWFSLVALLAIVILSWVGGWYKQTLTTVVKKATSSRKAGIRFVKIQNSIFDNHSAPADFLEIHLYGQHFELFHVLPDR
jgi:MFS family permease